MKSVTNCSKQCCGFLFYDRKLNSENLFP